MFSLKMLFASILKSFRTFSLSVRIKSKFHSACLCLLSLIRKWNSLRECWLLLQVLIWHVHGIHGSLSAKQLYRHICIWKCMYVCHGNKELVSAISKAQPSECSLCILNFALIARPLSVSRIRVATHKNFTAFGALL